MSAPSASAQNLTKVPREMFKHADSVRTLVLGEAIATIEGGNFQSAKSIGEIYCKNPMPADCQIFFEQDVYDNATLYVPAGSEEAYQESLAWASFHKIEGRHFSSIGAPVSDSDMQLIRSKDGIEVRGIPAGALIQAYSMGGMLVKETRNSSISGLPHGVYAIRAGSKIFKVAL